MREHNYGTEKSHITPSEKRVSANAGYASGSQSVCKKVKPVLAQ